MCFHEIIKLGSATTHKHVKQAKQHNTTNTTKPNTTKNKGMPWVGWANEVSRLNTCFGGGRDPPEGASQKQKNKAKQTQTHCCAKHGFDFRVAGYGQLPPQPGKE